MKKIQPITLVSLCLLCIALPFFITTFIPITDLPQHLAQIRLLEDFTQGALPPGYAINTFGANTLVYLLIGLNWMVFQPIQAGKAVVLQLVLAWAFSIYLLAKHKQRSIPTATIACAFIFNHNLYWGLLNFLVGFPVFAFWYINVIDYNGNRSKTKQGMTIVLMSLLLFFAHALWFLAGLIVLFVGNIVRKSKPREFLFQICCALPTAIWSGIWYLHFVAARRNFDFDVGPEWHSLPWERLHPQWLLNAVLGGLSGPTETVVCLGAVLWFGVIAISNRGQFLKHVERDFFWISVCLFLFVLVAPDYYMSTINYAQRWTPLAVIFFLLSLPSPRISNTFGFAGAALFPVVLALATCYNWYKFDERENSGLEQSLSLITKKSKVIGLDFVRKSKYVRGSPFMQSFAYAQVLHSSSLNFSLAEYHAGIVSLTRDYSESAWTLWLEAFPEQVKPEDIKQFDYALVNGTEYVHFSVGSRSDLDPLTTEGRWRLYRCKK